MSRKNLLSALILLALISTSPVKASAREFDSVPELPGTSIIPDTNGAQVFIHIRSEKQQTTADRIKKSLEEGGYAVPRIIFVNFGPSQNQVRYFHRERDLAIEVAREVNRLRLGPIKIRSIAHYERTMPQKRFEIWLAPDTQ
jgi:hypothetical protein